MVILNLIVISFLLVGHLTFSLIPFFVLLFLTLTCNKNISILNIKIKRIYLEIIVWLVGTLISLYIFNDALLNIYKFVFGSEQKIINFVESILYPISSITNPLIILAAECLIRKKISLFLEKKNPARQA